METLVKPGRNEPCRCGSGKKYKKCCLNEDREAERSMQAMTPELEKAIRELQAKIERGAARLRNEYGIYINYVSPVEFQGGKVWAIGTRVYADRPPNETFHEFLLHILRGALGEEWRAAQAAVPENERHFVMRCLDEYGKWARAMQTPENEQAEGKWRGVRNSVWRTGRCIGVGFAAIKSAAPDSGGGRLLLGRVVAVSAVSSCACGRGAAFALA